MKLPILTLALYFVLLSVHSQEVNLNWTDVEKPEAGGIGFIACDNTGTYCWSKGLIKLDNNNHEIARNELEPIADMKKFGFAPKIFLLGDRMWMVVSKYNKDEKARKVIAQEIDKTTLKYKGDYKVISETHGAGFWSTDAELFMNPTGSDKLVITSTTGEKPYFKLYDSNLELLRNTTEFNFGNTSTCQINGSVVRLGKMRLGKMDVAGLMGVVCDADNNVYFDVDYDPAKGSPVAEGNYVFTYLKEHSTPVKIQINRPDKDAGAETHIRLNDKNEVICAGFYYDRNNILPAGIIYDKIDNKGNLAIEKREKISEDVLNGLCRTEKEAGNLLKPSFEHSYLVHAFIFGEGSDVYLSFEHKRYQTSGGGNNALVSVGSEGDYQEIICVHVSDQGRIAWQQKIPRWLKSGYNPNTSPAGYVSTAVNGRFYVFYIDNPKNVNLANTNDLKFACPESNENVVIPRENQLGALFQASISENGTLDRKILENYTVPFTIHPNESYHKQKGEIILTGYDCSYKTNGTERRLSKIGTLKIK